MTQAGEFDQRLAFDKRGTASDGAGGTTAAWQEQFTCWAKATHLRGGEAVLSARLEGRHPVVFRVRRSAAAEAVTTDWRIRDTRNSINYAVRDVTPSTDRAYIDFLVESGAAA